MSVIQLSICLGEMLSRSQSTLENTHTQGHGEAGSVPTVDLTEVILSPLGFHGTRNPLPERREWKEEMYIMFVLLFCL